MTASTPLLPVFLQLVGRRALVVGGGPVALEKARTLLDAGASVLAVSPAFVAGWEGLNVERERREFSPRDVQGAWFVIAAAPAEVNRAVRDACESARVFLLSVDDPSHCSAFGAAKLVKGGVTFAISTAGRAPALVRLLREALERVLPDDLEAWSAIAVRERLSWKARGTAMSARRGLLFEALRELYEEAR